jgi:hypothetical protein
MRLLEGDLHGVDHGRHLGLGLGREVLVDIELADRLAQHGVGRVDARFQRATAAACLAAPAVEGEALVDEGLGQHVRIVVDQVEGQVVLPGLHALVGGGLAQARDHGRVPDDEARLVGQAWRR